MSRCLDQLSDEHCSFGEAEITRLTGIGVARSRAMLAGETTGRRIRSGSTLRC
jgi:hypothetical protein